MNHLFINSVTEQRTLIIQSIRVDQNSVFHLNEQSVKQMKPFG